MFIRDFIPGDEEAYAYIYNETYKACSWYTEFGSLTTEGARRKIERYRNTPAFRLLFAVIDNEFVGFITTMVWDDVTEGYIVQYEPCVLPSFQNQNVENKLVEAAIDHLQKYGINTIKYSIVGSPVDITHYVILFKKLGFKEWRLAQTMERSLETPIPNYSCGIPLKTLSVKELGVEAFVDFFIACFQDSQDRDASQIASNYNRAKRFIQHLYMDEENSHNPDLWFAAFIDDQFVGFTITRKSRNEGHIAEIGATPEFRRRGIGTFLTVESLKKLKQMGSKHAFLGVDKENMAAIALYEKLGFRKKYEIIELEKHLAIEH